MSARRVLAGSVAALLLPASLLLTTETGSATDSAARAASTSTAEKAGQKISLEVLPQIVQQGRGAASASSAKAAVTATIKPVKVGRKVVLEQLNGSSWTKVATAKQEKSGRAHFAALVSKGGLPLTYRATAQKAGGLKAVTSTSQDTSQWVTPTFTDEFSGGSLSSVWSMRGQDYEKQSKRACSKGSPKAVKVGGGALRLSVIKDRSAKGKCTAKSRKVTKKISYRLNGHVGTANAFSFRYGVAAARIKMHKLQGQHASFWLQPNGENQPGSDGHEIDVIEYFGDKHPQGGLTSFIHWYKGKRLIKTGSWIKDSKSFLKNKGDGWSKNYHVFSVQWTPKAIIFRIDGKETWRTSARVSKAQQYLILSLLASDYEALEMNDKKLPQHMYVDWVRVWETPQP
ncbi:glycoside hydrolase family 16 protein [Nocardioides sp. S-58]|uniref:Glycoside hydrolase family 16 protein n=1 Tax=Nocardioides renjunii TaxID=3095075 RepID=A0ABU5KE17_9ACTN|nr:MULTISPECIES: glycoside hydrolase family 16 protein [unclassified Nocardioides]MDZ5663210.1 glycoside hydrolase family 16 protein [Nocardioides sp. S-58]WQQ22910.1 glycoside hydrolase family 16 protein [Nocardioides sp. S-34]